MKKNIGQTLKNELCTGCGICEDVCPVSAIQIICKGSENRPDLNEAKCIGCGKCVKVCPGLGVNLNSLGEKLFADEKIKEDQYIGRYLSLYTGYSLNEKNRFDASSGGVLSAFLIFLLEKKLIDGAVVTAFSNGDHLTPVSYIARTPEDVLNASGSKYCPVALNRVGNEICAKGGRYVIVGLPCHIHGFRKRALLDKKFRECVVGYFNIFCSSNRSFNAQKFLLGYFGFNREKVSRFAFRGNGCLGSLSIESTDQNKKVLVPYVNYYGALRSFFKPRRCLTCIDHYGLLSDVNFGDIYIDPYKNDKIGINSVVVRNSYFDALLRQAQSEGCVHLDSLNVNLLNESQKTMLYPKKRKARAMFVLNKLRGWQNPQYDVILPKPSIKDLVSELVCEMQRFVGRHPSMWFVARYLFKKRMPKDII